MIFSTVALLMAMEDEATPIIKRLGLTHQPNALGEFLPFQVYQGDFQDLKVSLMTSGTDNRFGVDNVATQPATLMAYAAVTSLSPDIIVNAGTAGGFFAEDCRIGDIYLSDKKIVFHDRRIPIPGFDKYGVGNYQTFDTQPIAEILNLKRGRISTGNSLHHIDEDIKMMRETKAIIKDMEAAAIAWVCQITETPMFAVKAITDLLDRGMETEQQFTDNMNLAVSNLADTLPDLLNTLARVK